MPTRSGRLHTSDDTHAPPLPSGKRTRSTPQNDSAPIRSTGAPAVQPSYPSHMLGLTQPVSKISRIRSLQPVMAFRDGFIHLGAHATANQINTTPISVPSLQRSTPGFSATPFSQKLWEADVSIAVDSLETNNTEKKCNSEHSSERRETSGAWKYYTQLFQDLGGKSVKFKTYLRCAKLYKESTSTVVFRSSLIKHGLRHEAEYMVQSQLSIGMNMVVTTATTFESVRTEFEEELVK